jgi:hypothetical protein
VNGPLYAAVLLWVGNGFAVALDAGERDRRAIVWFPVVFFLGPLGVLAYVLRRHIVERCRVLAEAEFTVVLPRDWLENESDITGWGQRYLEGEIDADHRRPQPAPKPPGKMRPSEYGGFG